MPGVYTTLFDPVVYLHINMDPASDVSVGFRLDALHQNEVNLDIHIFQEGIGF